jgi:hypothetical protein
MLRKLRFFPKGGCAQFLRKDVVYCEGGCGFGMRGGCERNCSVKGEGELQLRGSCRFGSRMLRGLEF